MIEIVEHRRKCRMDDCDGELQLVYIHDKQGTSDQILGCSKCSYGENLTHSRL